MIPQTYSAIVRDMGRPRDEELDRKIIEEFFALKGGEPKTYQKISKELGISRERTRQRALQAMKRMRLAAMQRSPLSYELTRESTFR